jgi:hypothetical protein
MWQVAQLSAENEELQTNSTLAHRRNALKLQRSHLQHSLHEHEA